MDTEQMTRLNAQLMKTQNELNAERTKNIHLRKTLETELQRKNEVVLSTMMAELFQKQVETLTQNEKNVGKARDLHYREQKIEQLETFLSEGQKQFHYELDKRGIRPVDAIERVSIKRDAELAFQKDVSVIEGDISQRLERLHLRESFLQAREKQYRGLIRESLESEILEKSVSAEKVTEIAEVEYNNGFAAGKKIAMRAAEEESLKKGFLDGYSACQRAQSAIAKLRAGRIACDSPELDFLFDAAHPHNMYTLGAQMSQPNTKESAKNQDGKVEARNSIENGVKVVAAEKKMESSVRK